ELSWFTSQAGLSGARKLRVASPFDYPRQARLWVPRPFVRPNDAGHPAAVGALAARCAAVLGGRTFVLTTTLRAMQAIADAMHEAWQAAGVECELLIQGSQPRRALLERFGDGQGRVLVGSHSFWEGIDMPGDALQCVVIDKLPFPPPYEPLVEAKVRRVEKAGGRPFEEVHLAETAVALKQGAGRLIRSETDHGLLVVCDSRLAQMHYGQRLRAALPPMAPLADEAAALSWLAELAAR
ncbi:MAG TPA: ATP-dependent DNA helicase, partial [Rubrivivax sp.]|nr:ATP-dependent DNA helicase [Rubrivivax sp.]